MAILAGLSMSPIHRLARTKDHLASKIKNMHSTLDEVMTSSRNFAKYREYLATIRHSPPCIPFLGLYLTDLTFIEDGTPDFMKGTSDMINFSKRMKTAEIILEIQHYQNTLHNFQVVEELQFFIKSGLSDVASLSEDDLYQMSLTVEAKET